MRRLAAASAMWLAAAALVMLRVSAMRTNSASENRSGSMNPWDGSGAEAQLYGLAGRVCGPAPFLTWQLH